MNLKQIEAFVRIADNRSFSQTAKEMYQTQPTVSTSINNLESELGVRLFNRSAKLVELTEEGKKIYIYARQILDSAEAIRQVLETGEVKLSTRPLLIAASTIPAQYVLPGILGEFRKRFPEARFWLQETDSAGVIREIEEHRADIGFTGMAGDKSACEYIPICGDELVILTPNTAHYRTIQKEDQPLKWILKEPVIMRENGSGTRHEALKLLAKGGISADDLRITANLSSPTAILQSVKNGVGITVMSRLAAQESVEKGDLLAFPLVKEGARRSIYMVRSSHIIMSEAARQLVNIVSEAYKTAVW